MVSNARLDLPEPERPVTTTSRSRGISTETFFRLCTRAPSTAIVVRTAPRAAPRLEAIGSLREREERQLLNGHVALPGEMHGYRRLADESLVREILTRGRDSADVEVSL